MEQYSRVYNVDADHRISDSIIYKTESILCCGKKVTFDSNFFAELGIESANNIPLYYSNPLSNQYPPVNTGIKIDQNVLFKDDADFIKRMGHFMLLLLKTVPIITEKQKTYDGYGEQKNLLGEYRKESGREYIVLYSDVIFQNVGGDAIRFAYLTIQVLIHELAHALMDPNYYNKVDYNTGKYISYVRSFCGATEAPYEIKIPILEGKVVDSIEMNFYTAREESYANVLAYQIINKGDFDKHGFPSYVRQFIDSQLMPYKFAESVYLSKGIGSWIEAKYDPNKKIDQDTAFQWMDCASDFWNTLNNQKQISFPGDDKLDLSLIKDYRKSLKAKNLDEAWMI